MAIKMIYVIFGACVMVAGFGAGAAQDLVSARVLAIEGQVEIRRQPSDQALARKIAFKIDDELRAGDTIITGRRGRLALGLSDGSQAVIAPDTTVVIKDLGQSPRALFNVIRGKTRIHIEKLGGQPNPYRVNTPTAVIAVRGTIFDILVEGNQTQVFLHEGAVAVTNTATPDRPVFLSAGQMTRVFSRRLPNAPSPFKTGRNNKLFRFGNVIRIDENDRGSRRVAVNGSKPDFGNGGPMTGDGPRPDFGRAGSSSNGGSSGGPRPDFGHGGSTSSGPWGARPTAAPKPTGKKS
jgi:hypothetical protein